MKEKLEETISVPIQEAIKLYLEPIDDDGEYTPDSEIVDISV